MCGQWWPDCVEFGAGVVLDGVDGVVVVLGVDWVLVVPVAVLDPLGAAAAPAMPATAPPVASAPTTITALIVFALFIANLQWSVRGLHRQFCEPALSGPQCPA
jgi:hypothetical protein